MVLKTFPALSLTPNYISNLFLVMKQYFSKEGSQTDTDKMPILANQIQVCERQPITEQLGIVVSLLAANYA